MSKRKFEPPRQDTSVCLVKKTHRRSVLNTEKIAKQLQQQQQQQQQHGKIVCDKCKRSYSSGKCFQRHKSKCQSFVEKDKLKISRNLQKKEEREKKELFHKLCQHCQREFASVKSRNAHMRVHKRNKCSSCNKIFQNLKNLQNHLLQCVKHRKKKKIVCLMCKEEFPSRKTLYKHKMMQHGSGGVLLDVPYEQAPWIKENGEEDEEFRDIYNANRSHILKNTERLGAYDLYNFPTDNLKENNKEIEEHLDTIFTEQEGSFKINVNLGFIMQNLESKAYRYYIPYNNSFIFSQPFLVSTAKDLQRLKEKLRTFDPKDFVLKERRSTKERAKYITNLNYLVTKLDFPLGKIEDIPEYLLRNRFLKCFYINSNDNLCFFRCLNFLINKNTNLRGVLELFERWVAFSGLEEDFEGITLNDLPHLEECFSVNINVYQMDCNRELISLYVSLENYEENLNLNLFNRHLMYITDLSSFAHKFRCRSCDRLFKSGKRCRSHEKLCSFYTSYKLPGGYYHPDKNDLFNLLNEEGIYLDFNRRVYPYFITYDFEAILRKVDRQTTNKITCLEKHQPISVALHSNVKQFPEPVCFVNSNLEDLLISMIDRLSEIQSFCYSEMKENFRDVFKKLDEIRESLSQANGEKFQKVALKKLDALTVRLDDFCCTIPVIGFNSSKYDLNLIKPLLSKILKLNDEHLVKPNIIKRASAYLQIKTHQFKFLDVINFLAPGVSYAQFLKAYEVKEIKSYFPYDYFTDENILNQTKLPVYDAYFSRLKNKNLLEDEWKAAKYSVDDNYKSNGTPGLTKYYELKRTWKSLNFQNFEDYLKYYNVVDVRPFVEAVEKMLEFYRDRKICLFSSCLGIPGASRKLLFDSTDEKFALPSNKDFDLYLKYKANIIGGPSQVFTRYQEVGHSMGLNKNKCGSIQGWDAVSLYLWSIDQEQPCGAPVRRKLENQFRPEFSLHTIQQYVWLDLLSIEMGKRFHHFLNFGREKRVNRFKVDGFTDCGILAEFYGCYFHGCCKCKIRWGKDEQTIKKLDERYRYTMEREEYIKSQGYRLITIWECEFKEKYARKFSYKQTQSRYLPPHFRKNRGKTSEEKLIRDILNGNIFGVCEVDISVPEELKREFSNFPPIFGNCDVPYEQFGDHMRNFVDENDISKKTRRLLIGTFSGEKLFLATPLLKWYVNRGLKITKLHEVVEYIPKRCFTDFVKTVSNARRLGDKDPNQMILSDTYKLIGNSAYGSTLVNKERYRKIIYCKGDDKAKTLANSPSYMEMTRLEGDFYEVQTKYKQMSLNTTTHLGFFILQYAKLRMLQFFYSVIHDCIDETDYNLLQMDTDSLYGSFHRSSLIHSMRSDKKLSTFQRLFNCTDEEVAANESNFFPRICCTKHKLFDKRTAGLFKLESEGHTMVCLCSKTYSLSTDFCDKFSMKGVTKRFWSHPTLDMKQVLKEKKNKAGLVVGIRNLNRELITYKLEKNALNYFYVKRTVLEDGITTKPLDICIRPRQCVDSYIVEEFSENPLCLKKAGIYYQFIQSFPSPINKATPSHYVKISKLLTELLERKCVEDEMFKNCLLSIKEKHIVYCNEKLFRFWTSGLSAVVCELCPNDNLKGRNTVGLIYKSLRDKYRE